MPHGSHPANEPKPTSLLTIGSLAEQSGVTLRTLRYYEELNLITPAKRSEGRYRLYHSRTLKRVKAILALQELNYSLEAIQVTLGSSAELTLVENRVQRVQLNRAAIERQLACVKVKLEQLQTLQAELNEQLTVLSTYCNPCCDKERTLDCFDACQHRDAHLD